LLFHAPGGLWPIVNRGVPALLYCFIFLFIAARGPGRFAIDKKPAARG
jgi:putative oxidoreductase